MLGTNRRLLPFYLSYAVGLIAPIILGLLLFFRTSELAEREIDIRVQFALERAAVDIESIYGDVEFIVTQATLSEPIVDLSATSFLEPLDKYRRLIPSSDSFTAGYSQGGHAALAAADLLPDYAPEIDLIGAVGFGSTNSVETLMREAGFYPPNIIYAYMSIYGDRVVRAEEILLPQWLENLEYDVLTMCVSEFQLYYPYDVRGLYTDRFYDAIMDRRLEDEFPVFKRILDENESGLSGHGLPVLLVQGNQDIIVSNAAQREYAERLRATGSAVTLLELEGVRHRDTRPAGFVHSVEFIRALSVR